MTKLEKFLLACEYPLTGLVIVFATILCIHLSN